MNYLEESEEPFHSELSGNESFRVFRAVIPPGAETLYHRHSQDGIVVVIEGGRQATAVIGPSRTRRFMFPGPWGAFRKLTAGVDGILTGFMPFSSGEFFATMYRGYPIVHKVTASPRNSSALILMDIQVLPLAAASSKAPREALRGARKRLVTDRFAASQAIMAPGAGAFHFGAEAPTLVLSLDGGLFMAGSAGRADLPAALGKGQFRLFKSGERLELRCVSGQPSRALFLIV